MSVSIIDSHCHLDDERFDQDRDLVMQRASQIGVNQFVVPATTRQSWPRVKQLAQDYPAVHVAYGLHPYFMQQHSKSDVAALDAWLQAESAVAVGECGLDFYISPHDEQQQLELFRGQLEVAANHGLPVIIHARKALDIVIRELRKSAVSSGVIHSFSGSLQQAETLYQLGFKLGIAAPISFERAQKLRGVVSQIELDALLIETDAPDQPGAQHRGQRNEPAYIVDHLQVMAELRDLDQQTLARHLSDNCRQLFDI